MGSISLLQWRKSYMLEFLKGGEVEECFTFALPPESEDFQFPQRLTETKTFSGSIFEDYGNDTYKIVLSGSTVNEEKKLIYRGGKLSPKYLTGTDEIFTLQETIRDWNSWSADKAGVERKVYLYDLSKMSVLQIAAGTASRNWWRVFIKDLKIKRDKSNPLAFKYTLEMAAVEEESSTASGILSTIADAVETITDVAETVESVLSGVEGAMAALNEVASCASKVKTAYETMQNRSVAENVLNVTTGLLGSAQRILGGGSGSSLYNSAKDLLAANSTLSSLFNSETSGEAQGGKVESTNKYTVSFEVGGGSAVSSQTVLWKEQATRPTDPTKDRYTFDGWYTDEALTTEYDFATKVTSSFTLYAGWTLATAKITYNALNNKASTAQYVAIGEYATPIDDPEKSGYVFSQWCTDAACTTKFDFETTAITGDLVLYAAWEKLCSVFFDSQGGTKIETQSVRQNSLCSYPLTPEKENYIFLYWTDSYSYDEETETASFGAAFDFYSGITDDTTLYAVYSQVSNTLSFNSMGGSAVESQTVLLDEYAARPENPSREGYAFSMWTTDTEGTNEFFFGSTLLTKDRTLYAQWELVYLTVKFDSRGGTEFADQSIGYGQKAVFPGVPEREGHVFLRWKTEGGDEYDFSQAVKEELTLYAEWHGE